MTGLFRFFSIKKTILTNGSVGVVGHGRDPERQLLADQEDELIDHGPWFLTLSRAKAFRVAVKGTSPAVSDRNFFK